MYYYIKGKLELLEVDKAVIDCGGVGYFLNISKKTYEQLIKNDAFLPDGNISEITVKLFTYLNIREDAMELFGFFTELECSLFKMLISVSGVGPRVAISVLSTLSPESFINAVISQDAKMISSAQGIGLKSAQKIIIELKDKLSNLTVSSDDNFFAEEANMPTNDDVKEAINALTVLGYSKNEATKAVKAANGSNLEELIRNALAMLI